MPRACKLQENKAIMYLTQHESALMSQTHCERGAALVNMIPEDVLAESARVLSLGLDCKVTASDYSEAVAGLFSALLAGSWRIVPPVA